MAEILKKNLIAAAIVVTGLIVAGVIVWVNQGEVEKVIPGNLLTPQEAAEKAIDYINQNFVSEGITASLISVVEEGSVYKIRLKVGEGEYDSYVTKDGNLLFPEGYELTVQSEEQTQEEQTSEEEQASQEELKSDTPNVKLFIMSYCPFGLQAQKMFLPVYDLLKDKAKMGVYFVNYIMHGQKEIDENLRQYCIQKEEMEKYDEYLSCFVKNGDFEKCLSEANINRTKLSNCISETDEKYKITEQYNDQSTWLSGMFPRFDVHTDLNEKYGVRGSPTIVINDQVVSLNSRSPEDFKDAICRFFDSQPKECSQNLSNDVPSSGLGEGTGSSNGGSCQ